ncbi:hypothetical protein [Streptomyces murinus]|uniref:hypothetical protein n=1 Tax=Streptomyces murinus TaxID=33900 RepID=UPI0038067FB6
MSVMSFRAACAESTVDGHPLWVVVDDSCRLHHEACVFLALLRGMGQSFNAEKVYSISGTLLTWCSDLGLNWKQVTLLDLARVLRFCSRNGWMDAELLARLSESKYLNWLPPGKEAGEDDQFRDVRAHMLKLPNLSEEAPNHLTPEQLLQVVTRAGDRFLVALLGCAGARIGEVLGMGRQDIHLLSGSRRLGCSVAGPGINVPQRANDVSEAPAKSRFAEGAPVAEDLARLSTACSLPLGAGY